ncbi:MAG TPA: hypothetical protein VMU10_08045 [Desulfomonilia bacterium]|nr:hypothetical protein [Desulfomonilia bacterium]
MEVGPDYIIVLEKKIMVVDTTSWGKRVKTIISDGKGKDLDRRNLKKGVIVFVKGSLADDEQNGDVLAATEIYIVPHLLGPKDAKEYKGFMVPATPW